MAEILGRCNPAESKGGGLYLHVAYCRRKCIYCDFFSAGERIADWHRYVNALCSEFENRINELAWPLRTVYFGGGTPSLMPIVEFSRLCAFLRPYMSEIEEFTLEVNPDDVDESKLDCWKIEGVNRLSMGVQTFDDKALTAIGRRHDSRTALRAYEMARKVFQDISIDLMFGLPSQSLETWRHDLEMALELRPEHISAYSLMYEPGTALTMLRDSGRITEPSEEMTVKMFSMLIEMLSESGYEHYEISNFALPGFRSRHNSSYWLQKPYIGLGPSAHSYDGIATRKSNRADLRAYLDHWRSIDSNNVECERGVVDEEHLTDEELLEEYVMTRMRMKDGIPFSDFRMRFGDDALSRLMLKSRFLAENGLVKLNEGAVSLTEKAILVSDSIILDLADL